MIKKGGYFVVTYVDIIKKWKEKKIDSIEKLDQQLSNFRIIFAYNSGAIENSQITYHDTREIFENGKVVNFSGDTRTIFEIENQRKCYNYLAPKIINKDPPPEVMLNCLKSRFANFIQSLYVFIKK